MQSNRFFLTPFLFMLLALASACAVAEKENRRLLNQLDPLIQAESTGARIALAPVMVPLGTVAGAVDMVLVHPVAVIPDVADDIYELYWKPREMDLLRKSLLFPVSVVLTPPTFVIDWLGRSIFDL